MLNNPKCRDKPLFITRKYPSINAYKIGFNLSSINMCVISYTPIHLARHSFAVNVLNGGANIKTLASLLGHSGIKHTEKYTRAIDSLRQDAINSLGNIIIPQTTPTHAVK